ncbi:hypothetical protein TTHERM_00919680 (macronuclear) [Tetrahymena thermophila SB210]|uniref:Uncharacterized protein n=1 Tax=Tetrahymena thermophila (strain SB210) TaxID=312017 RepID=Q24IK6_TETTS|nr:hypothetical protein TTHERM_00919680 [Tetrahymena thermophila SB210]EAS07619.3 hypothetical protein TTHERM_00919680 [Tetrahymena thermophila SB210]|eukprot:XP_001027861.3 hypothetical protein TTHERM_00919680 [Tetrahymena thermophila SB210]
MLKQITIKKELNRQCLDEVIKSYGENQYLYVIGIFYQQRASTEFIFNQIFGYDFSQEIDQQEKAVFAYKSDKDQYSNLIFLFSNFQFIDQDFNYVEEFIFECSDVLINLDFTMQDSYQSLESYISKNLKERENPYVKKEINYIYPLDQDIKELDKKDNIDEQENQLIYQVNRNKGNVIQRCLKQQESKDIQESLVLKIQELEKYQMIPIPIQKINTLFSIIWDNLLLNQNKNSLFQLKQIIVGSHYEEQWDMLVKEMQQWSKQLHIQCMEGMIHDFNIQKEEYRKISEKWKVSSVFLKGFLQVLDENYVKEQINQEIQKQIFKLFNFQLNYIKSNLNEIFQKKLTEIQNQEKQQLLQKQIQQSNQKPQQKPETQQTEQQPNQNQQIDLSQSQSSPQFKFQQSQQQRESLSNSNPNQSINISKFASQKVSSDLNFSQIEFSNNENNEIQQKINDISFSQDLIGLQRQNSNKSSVDLHNQTFGLLDVSIVEEPIGQIKQIKEKSSEQDSEDELDQKLILKRVGSETYQSNDQTEANKLESSTEVNQNNSNQSNENIKSEALNSPAQIKAFNTGIQNQSQTQLLFSKQKNFKGSGQYFQIEKSQKIPNKLAYSQSPNIKQKSIERGRNSIRQNQSSSSEIQEYKLFEILEKTKNQVKIEIKTKMFDTLDQKSKEELGQITEYEQIEIQIIELITTVLEKRASLEVQDFVKQKIITRLKTDISDLFTNKDQDFWVKFKGIKNKIIDDQEKKIYEYLKDNFKLPKNNSNELIKKSKEVCLKEVKKLMKAKIEEITSDFVEELQANDKKIQDKQSINFIYDKYEDFVIAFKDGLENDNDSKEEDLINQCNKILIELQAMKENYKNIVKFKYNTLRLQLQKLMFKKEKLITSIQAFTKINQLTLTLLIVFSILSVFENVPLASSVGIILISHILYTIYKLK